MPDTEIFKQFFNTVHEDLQKISGKVDGLETQVNGVKTQLARQEGAEIGKKIESHESRISALEGFKNKLIGALIISHAIWISVSGILVGLMLWMLTKK